MRRVATTIGLLVPALLPGCSAPPSMEPGCPSGQVTSDSDGACVPEVCGAGAWGETEPDGGTLHVATWGDDGGDGSRDRPLRSLGAAIDLATAGAGPEILLAAGAYEENLRLDDEQDGIVIVGRCRELVRIDGSGVDEPTLRVDGGDIDLRGITLSGGRVGLWVQAGGGPGGRARIRADRLTLSGNHLAGLLVAGGGGRVEATDLVVDGTEPTTEGEFGRGVDLEAGGTLEATGLVLEGNADVGFFAWNAGTTATVHGGRFAGTLARPDGNAGRGIEISDGATFDGSDLTITENRDSGVLGIGDGTRITLSASWITDTRPIGDGSFGRGLELRSGATLLATDLSLSGNRDTGLFASDPGTTAELRGGWISDTATLPDGSAGRGVELRRGASLTLIGTRIEGNHDVGLLAAGPGTTLLIDGAEVIGTLPSGDGEGGRGVSVLEGASVSGTGLWIDGNRDVGLFLSGAGTQAVLEGVTVQRTTVNGVGRGGRGIGVQEGASLDASGLVVMGNTEIGLFASQPGTAVRLAGARVAGTLAALDGMMGRGVDLEAGATLLATDLRVEDNRDIGVFVDGTGTTAEIDALSVIGTSPREDGAGGSGVMVQSGGALSVATVTVIGNHGGGIVASGTDSHIVVSGGRVAQVVSAQTERSGIGLVAQDGATLEAEAIRVEDNAGPGVYVYDAVLDLVDSELVGNSFAGASVLGAGVLTMRGGRIEASVGGAGQGGGLGVFAWGRGAWPKVELVGVELSTLPGPALYLRGRGRYRMTACEVREGGTWPAFPGGVLAVDGVGPWDADGGPDGLGSGLLLEGDRFSSLAADAILLDGSSGTLARDPQGGAANTFSELDGEPLFAQRCGDLPPAEVQDDAPVDPTCRLGARPLGPLLTYEVQVAEAEPSP